MKEQPEIACVKSDWKFCQLCDGFTWCEKCDKGYHCTSCASHSILDNKPDTVAVCKHGETFECSKCVAEVA